MSSHVNFIDENTIHAQVQARYGQIAASQSCCSPTDCDCNSAKALYDAEQVQDLPADVFSLGCGDPVTIASLQADETVLDLGSGAGMDCFLSARQVGTTGRVIGVDMTPAMLAKARANQEKLGLQNVEFREGYIEKLPVEDNSVDVIMSNCVINLSPDKGSVFQEIFRVLKPGGRVAVSDMVTEGDFSATMRADAAQWAACVSGAIDVQEYTALMSAAGLVDIRVVDKFDATEFVPERQHGPRLFSARITARKP